ncbi:MAG: hypothetical protein ACRDWW_01185 [Acidimicrobiales bacterium]
MLTIAVYPLAAMAGYRSMVRDVRTRVFPLAAFGDEVERRLGPEFAEVRRILGDQGDAADEVAEILGRTIAKLSVELEDLAVEVARLRDRLDGIEATGGKEAAGREVGSSRPQPAPRP